MKMRANVKASTPVDRTARNENRFGGYKEYISVNTGATCGEQSIY